MFFKKKELYFKEEKWYLGSQIEKSGVLLFPVFKMSYEGTSQSPFFSHGKSVLQGVLKITGDEHIWLTNEDVNLGQVIKHLPQVKVYMNKEATHEC